MNGSNGLTTDVREWGTSAECIGYDPEIFFSGDDIDTIHAKMVCNSCRVRFECLMSSIKNRDFQGVLGGRTPTERKELSKQLGFQPIAGDDR